MMLRGSFDKIARALGGGFRRPSEKLARRGNRSFSFPRALMQEEGKLDLV